MAGECRSGTTASNMTESFLKTRDMGLEGGSIANTSHIQVFTRMEPNQAMES